MSFINWFFKNHLALALFLLAFILVPLVGGMLIHPLLGGIIFFFMVICVVLFKLSIYIWDCYDEWEYYKYRHYINKEWRK